MAVTQGTVTKSFVSAIDFLDQRDIDPKIYDQSRDRAFTDIMKIVGRYKPCTMFNYHSFVNNDVYETMTVSAVTTTGTAAPVFTVNTGTGFPRKGDLIMSSNTNNNGTTGARQALVTNVTFGSGTATITARSVGGNSKPFFVTVGDTVTASSNANSEKSDAPTNRRYGVTKYYNQVQIFREVDEITDVQKVAKIEVQVGGENHILPYQTLMKKIKLEGDISVQMLMGEQSVTSFGDANPFLTDPNGNGLPVQTTGGLDWYITNYGIADSKSDTTADFSFTDLEDIIDNFIANKAPIDNLMAFSSSKAKRKISKWAKNLGSSGVTSVRLEIDGRSADFNVDQIEYGGAKIDFVYVPIFDHPQLVFNIRADVAGSLYIMPKDSIDTLDNGLQPRIQIRHTPSPFGMGRNGSNNGLMAEWRTGALAEVPTSSVAQLHTDWYAVQGLECIGVKHFQKYRIA